MQNHLSFDKFRVALYNQFYQQNLKEGNMKQNRLLILHKILQREANEENPLTSSKILELLKQKGLSPDRKTLYRDLNILKATHIPIKKNGRAYYIVQGDFTISELRILCDAARSAKFLLESERKALLKKIGELTNKYDELLLQDAPSSQSKTKIETAGKLIETIEVLLRGIAAKKIIRFSYGLLKPMQNVELSPYRLFWRRDQYFLSGYNEKIEGVGAYYVRYISQAMLTRKQSKPLETLRNQQHSPEEPVSLRFANHLLPRFWEYFGPENPITRLENHFLYTGNAILCAEFVSWLIQFGPDVVILHPQKLKKMLLKHIAHTARIYIDSS